MAEFGRSSRPISGRNQELSMTSRPRTALALLAALAVLLVPTLGTPAADAVGTGAPVIVTPADGEGYVPGEVPDLVVDFGDAPYGSYAWSVKDDSDQTVHSGTVDYESGDADQQDLTSLADLGSGAWTASVTGTAGTVTSSFGTVILGPPPVACTVQVPAQVRVVSSSVAVYPRFHHCEDWTVTWTIRHRVGSTSVKFGTFRVTNGFSAGPWRFRDSYPTGRYLVEPPDVGGPNETEMIVRFGSRTSLVAGAKTGGRFRLSGTVTRYVASVDGFRGWANRPVAISYKNCASGCAWRFLVTAHTDGSGHYSLTGISSQVRYWRATVGNTASVWGSRSPAVKR